MYVTSYLEGFALFEILIPISYLNFLSQNPSTKESGSAYLTF